MTIYDQMKGVFFINVKTAEKLGIEIPYDILESATVIIYNQSTNHPINQLTN